MWVCCCIRMNLRLMKIDSKWPFIYSNSLDERCNLFARNHICLTKCQTVCSVSLYSTQKHQLLAAIIVLKEILYARHPQGSFYRKVRFFEYCVTSLGSDLTKFNLITNSSLQLVRWQCLHSFLSTNSLLDHFRRLSTVDKCLRLGSSSC